MATLSVRNFAKASGRIPPAGTNISIRLIAQELSEPSPTSVKNLIQYLGQVYLLPRQSLTMLYQTEAFTDHCFIVGVDGYLYDTLAYGYEAWQAPGKITVESFASPGASVGATTTPPGATSPYQVMTCAVIGSDGRLYTAWLPSYQAIAPPFESFAGPVPIGTPFSQPGGGVALVQQAGIVTAVAIGNDGRLYVASTNALAGDGSTGNPSWNVPTPVGDPVAPAGAYIAMAKQTSTSPSAPAAFIGVNGSLYVASVAAGVASSPVMVSLGRFAPPGAPIALYPQNDTKTAAVFIGNDGRLWYAYTDTGAQGWSIPTGFGQPVAPPGAQVALGKPTTDILTCIFVGNDQRLWSASIAAGGGSWTAATPISSFPFANAGAPVGLLPQFDAGDDVGPDRLVGMALGTDGQLYTSVVTGTSAFTDPTPLPFSNPTTTGTLRPKYQVLTILYSPPGTSGGKSTSSVNYQNSLASGTSSSITSTFKHTYSATASLSVGGEQKDPTPSSPVTIGVNGGFSSSTTRSDTSSLQITATVNSGLMINGPSADGIDHDQDLMVIWLNPIVNVLVDGWGNVLWDVDVDGNDGHMDYQYFPVGGLKNPSTMDPGLLKQLTDAGLTDTDFQNILALNPFAYGATVVDTNRFQFVAEKPYSAAGTSTLTCTDAQTSAYSSTSTTEYDVSVTVSAGLKLWIINASASFSDQLAWTNSGTNSTSKAESNTSTVIIGGPSAGYVSPPGFSPTIQIYWDTVYRTFMFAFLSV